jgi:dihydrolipoamide dehydrogenase
MEKFDIVVIGAGPGGYPAAIRAAQLGAKTAIIEREQLGGTCLNWGCIPTKTLIASSELVHRMKLAEAWGAKADKVSFDYAAMVQRKDGVVEKLRGGVGQLLKANGVTLFQGNAAFEARNRIAIEDQDGKVTKIEAGKTILATGSESVLPGFLPTHKNILESRAFLDRDTLPKSMIVMGGGIIGCELACMAAQLGCKVTIVEMLDDIMLMLDKDVCRAVRQVMENDLGIRILTGNLLENIEVKRMVQGTVNGEEIKANWLLVATGRRPVTHGLELEKAGVEVNEHGFITVDEFGQTNVPTIYAIGDVNGGPQLAHAATSQGVTVAESAFTGKLSPVETLVPACIFTVPEVGGVGLTEKDAKEKGIAVKVGKFAFAGLGKAMAAGDTTGFVKWIADADTDQLLGAHAVGAHATELIAEAAVAIRAELTAAEIGQTIHCHPTYSESWMEAAHALHGTCIHGAPKRKRK